MTRPAASPAARRLLPALLAALLLALLAPAAAPARADWVRDLEWWLDDYGIRAAWQTTRGQGVTVAVIDSGVDGAHPDLAGAVAGGTDVSGHGRSNGQRGIGTNPDHGTMVASLLAARGRDGDGMIGVAPRAKLLTVSIGFGLSGDTDQQVADAVRWSVDQGASVINMSLTRNSPEWPESWDEAFQYAFEHDVVVVAAAGNRGSGTTQVGAPATIPGVLTVAGVDRRGRASFDASSQGITIAVSAPSEDLVGAIPGGGYVTWSGTSGAAPIVAGVVALVRSAHPELDAANTIQRVIATAKPRTDRELDPIYGHGLIDARAAVTAEVAPVSANPMGDLAEWIRLYRRGDAPTPVPVPGEPGSGEPVESAAGAGFWDFLPTVTALRNDALPALVLGGFGLCAVLLLFAAARHFWRIARRE